RVAQARQRLGQLGLAIAVHAGDAEDFAGLDVEGQAAQGGAAAGVLAAQVADEEAGRRGRGGGRDWGRGRGRGRGGGWFVGRGHHRFGELCGGGVLGGGELDQFAAAE